MNTTAESLPQFAAPFKAGYDPAMTRTAWRWLYACAVFFLIGPTCWWLIAAVPAADGSLAAGATLSSHPLLAVLTTGAAFLIAAGVGVAASRLFSERSGLACAGLALAWTPWAVARMDDLVRQPLDRSVFPALAVEGALVGVLGLLAVFAIAAGRRPRPQGQSDELMAGRLLGPLIAFLVGGVAAWAVARSYAPGQGLAAAVAAGLFGVLVGKVVDIRSPDRAYFFAFGALAIACPLVTAFGSPASAMERVYAGDLFPPGAVMPIDWIAGALLGAPIGSAWASAMVEKRSGD